MQEPYSNSVRFVKLRHKNYGVFLGSNEIHLDHQRTLIVGSGGTGKTIIVNVLANSALAKGMKPHFKAKSP